MEHRTAVTIWQDLEKRGARVRYRSVSIDDIAAAEKELSIRLPPSYVELVTTLGAPAVLPRLRPRADPSQPENLDFTVLTPSEIVEKTYELRDSIEPQLFEDPAAVERVQDALDECVLFQYGLDAGEGFVFLLDTDTDTDTDAAAAHGEMKVAEYSNETLEDLDWDPQGSAVLASFTAAQARVAEQVIESWSEYAD